MKIVLTGAKGQLGCCLLDRFPKDWGIFAFDSDKLDITNQQAVSETLSAIKPNIIINAAAYTAVDKAEDEVLLAEKVNVDGVRNLALAAKSLGAKLIHVSTDYVFDGESNIPYLETDKINPQSVYGRTKLEGELAAQAAIDDLLIFRTSWVFSEYGNNFYKTMLRLFNERDSLSIVNDQIGKPTYAGDLAYAIIQSIEKNIPSGIYHYSGDNIVSWYQFAEFIYQEFTQIFGKFVSLKAITSAEFPQKAKRPTYSVMSNQKIELHGVNASDWQSVVKRIIRN